MKKSSKKYPFLDKTYHSFPITWCVELNKIVSADDVPTLQKQHSEELTFQCCECIFYLHELGIRAMTGFIQKKEGIYDPELLPKHGTCLRAIFDKDLLPETLFSLQDFENAFIQVDSLAQDASVALITLRDTMPALQQELCSETQDLETTLEEAQQAFYLFDRKLARIVHAYKALRREVKNF